MTGPTRIALAAWLVLTLIASHAQAQSAALTGRVVDAQTAVVVNAQVTLSSSAARTLTRRTDAEGRFTFDGLSDGEYTLQVDAAAFAPWGQKVVVRGESASLTITLQVAGLTEAVSVVGSSPTTLTRPTMTGSRLGLTPLETPASVQIISGDVVRERGDASVAEAKTRAVGITTQGNPGNGGGAVIARGFAGVGSVMQLFDGDQLLVGSGTVTFPFDPWTVERIEVLGGPASVLYGNGAIGGVVNVVPRKPNPFSRENSVRIAAGSFNTWRGAIDSAGPINDRTSYRLDLSGNRSDGWMERGHSDSGAFSGSVRHAFNSTLALTVSEDYGRQDPEAYFGTPTVNGVINEPLRKVNYNVADADITYKDNWTQAKLEWQPSPNLQIRTGVHLLASDRHWRNVENYTFTPATSTMLRNSYIEIYHHQRQYGDRTEAVFSRRIAGHANTLSAGFDYNYIRFQHVNNGPFDGASSVDLLNTQPGSFLNLAGTTPRFETHTNQAAAFAEDRFALDSRLSLVGGLRIDRYGVERLDLVTSGVATRSYAPVSGRGGVVYQLAPQLSLYGQYATATDTIGNVISNTPSRMLLDPTTGRQWEAGVKQAFWEQRGEWTVAAYRIVKNKLLAPVPDNPAVTQQIGQQSSRGIEATASVALPVGVRIDANASLLDARFDDFAETIRGTLVSRVGNTPPGVPERTANVWLSWNAPRRLQFRGGLRYVGQRYWDNANSAKAPGYTVVDAGVRRALTAKTALDLRVFNLFDTRYASTFYSNSAAPQWLLGAPRSAELALTVGF